MNFLLRSLVALALIFIPSGLGLPQTPTGAESCLELLQAALVDRSHIKSGSTRKEIEKYFRHEGGLQFRRTTHYVYPKSPYIHVDVEFQPSSDEATRFSPDDKAVNVSKLYLDYSVKD